MKFRSTQLIHFTGIGGVGMSGIAEVLLTLGYEVTGSDIEENARIRNLQRRGAKVEIGHSPRHVEGVDVVVRTSAVGENNCEIQAAREQDIPVIPRAEMLAELMRLKKGIAVAGTHGKTTTTAMVSHLLQSAEYDPTVVVGGRMHNLGIGARLGSGEHIVVEADESDGSFLRLAPVLSVVTNIEDDHMDYYDSMSALIAAFKEFINSVPFYGFTAICGDDPRLKEMLPEITRPHQSYGFAEHNQLRAVDCKATNGRQEFTVLLEGEKLGQLDLPLPGRFNVLNALGATAIALELGVGFATLRQAFESFQGVARRFDFKGRVKEFRVYDDYAHHPTEIKKTLEAARQALDGELLVVFQPHRYSRTKQLAEEFGPALKIADKLCVTDVYPAGEEPVSGIDLNFLRRHILPHRKEQNTDFKADREKILDWVVENYRPGKSQVLFTLGAGDVVSLAEPAQDRVLEKMRGD